MQQDSVAADRVGLAIREAEELDLHVADEHQRLRRQANAGKRDRPRKSKAAVLVDMSMVFRDKKQWMDDLVTWAITN